MPQSLQFALQNQSSSSEVYVYITGLAIQNNWQRCFIQANGTDLYYPSNPSAPGSPLQEDCAIALGSPGNTVNVTVPQLAGARLWVSMDSKLTFLVNPGPGLVEPSVLNPSDPNAKVNFGFCEFTLNNDQIYANITYVDFVPLVPIAISLTNASGNVQQVLGMPPDGLARIAADLQAQAQQDGRPWDKLIVQQNGQPFRILNPTHGNAVGADFSGYFEPYVDQVWEKYRNSGSNIKLNTQAAAGVVTGSVNDKNEFVFGCEAFQKPTTADILGCNSGPFTTGPSADRNAIIPRLAAAFVRTTLISEEIQPSGPDTFYKNSPVHEYGRIVHKHNIDGKGYTFAYDDVQQDGAEDQSGKVNDGAPTLFTVAIGGQGSEQQSCGPPPQPYQQSVSGQSGSYDRPPPPPPQRPEHSRSRSRQQWFADKIQRFGQKILK